MSGVIDFELARPGLAMEDAVFAALRVAHLRSDELAGRAGFDEVPDRRARLAAFAEGYGCRPDELLNQALAVQADELGRMLRLGESGLEPWATFLRRGLAAEAELELEWLEAHLPDLRNP